MTGILNGLTSLSMFNGLSSQSGIIIPTNGLIAHYKASSLLTSPIDPSTLSGLTAHYRADSIQGTAPNTIGSCVGWFRADMGITQIAGAVSGWADQSGHGNNLTQSNVLFQPTFVSSSSDFSNQPVISFNAGVGTWLSSVDAWSLGLNTTFMFIGEDDGIHVSYAGSNNGSAYYINTHDGYYTTVGGSYFESTVATSANTPRIFIISCDSGGDGVWWINSGLTNATGSAGLSHQPGLTVGALNDLGTASFLQGKIAEVAVFTGALTQQQVCGLMQYAAARYGISAVIPVPQWVDQSGTGDSNKNATQSTQANMPTLNVSDSTYDNRATISFSGVAEQYMTSGTWTTPLPQPSTIIVVGNADNSTSAQFFIDKINDSGGRNFIWNGEAANHMGMGGTNEVDNTNFDNSKPNVVCAVYNGASSTLRINTSTALQTGDSGTSGLDGITLGAGYTISAFLNGKIAEVIIVNRALSQAEIAGVIAYATQRYDIPLSVGGWLDQSTTGDSNQNLAQTSLPAMPTLNVSDSAYNNQTTLSFTAASSQEMVSGTWATQLNSPLTVFFIGESAIGMNNGYLLDGGSSSFQLLMLDNANNIYMHGSAFIYSSTPISASPQIIGGLLNGASSAIYVSAKTAAVVDDAGSGSIASLVVGQAESQYLQGKVAEILIYNRALTQGEVNEVLEDLGGVYGISIGA